jgi:hypothetical protein
LASCRDCDARFGRREQQRGCEREGVGGSGCVNGVACTCGATWVEEEDLVRCPKEENPAPKEEEEEEREVEEPLLVIETYLHRAHAQGGGRGRVSA